MPKKIKFEGKIHDFPDDTTDEEIESALSGGRKEYVIKPKKESSLSKIGRVAAPYAAPALATGGALAAGLLAPGTGGLSVLAPVAGAYLAGTGGGALESLLKGEKPKLGKSLEEGQNQALMEGAGLAGRAVVGSAKGLATAAKMVHPTSVSTAALKQLLQNKGLQSFVNKAGKYRSQVGTGLAGILRYMMTEDSNTDVANASQR